MRISWKYRRMIAIIIAAIIIAGVLRYFLFRKDFPITPQEDTEKIDVIYRYNYDGDTAVFIDLEGRQFECRFLCIDTPEKEEALYEEAKTFTDRKLKEAARIILEIDPHGQRYDKFDRLLAWVWVDDELLQAQLIEKRLAIIAYLFNNDYLYLDYLYELQNKNVTQP